MLTVWHSVLARTVRPGKSEGQLDFLSAHGTALAVHYSLIFAYGSICLTVTDDGSSEGTTPKGIMPADGIASVDMSTSPPGQFGTDNDKHTPRPVVALTALCQDA